MSDQERSPQFDSDEGKGAVASDRPDQPTNVDHLRGQNDHRDQRPIKKANDTDFPEPGNSPEYSMQKQEQPNKNQGDPIAENKDTKQPDLHPKNDPDGNAEGQLNDQNPGEAQKRNQNDKKNDDLAA